MKIYQTPEIEFISLNATEKLMDDTSLDTESNTFEDVTEDF